MNICYSKLFSFLILISFFFGVAQANQLPFFYNWVDNNQGGQGGEVYYQYSTDNIAYSNQTWTAGPPAGWKHGGASFDIVRTTGGNGNISIYSGFGASQGYEAIAWKPPANTTISGLYSVTGIATSIQAGNFKVSVYNYSETGTSTLLASYAFTGTGQIQTISVTGINVTTAGFIRIVLDNQGDSTNDQVNLTDVAINGPAGFVRYFTIKVFDELTPSVQKGFNLTISNSTNTTDYTLINVPLLFFAPLMPNYATVPTGDITITFKNNTCLTTGVLPRSFYGNSNNDSMNFIGYLLCDGSTPLFVRANVWTQTQAPLANVSVVVYKQIGSGYSQISNGLTSGNGIFPIYLQANGIYIYSFSKLTYTPLTLSVIAAVNDFYVVMLTNNTLRLETIFNGIGRTIRPSNLFLPNSTTAMVEYNITTSTNSTISWFSMNLSYHNGTTAFFYNNTNMLGGNITAFIDTSKEIYPIRGDFNFSRIGLGQYNETYFFQVMQINSSIENTSMKGFLNYLSNSSGGRFVKATIALGITFGIALVIAPFSTVGAGFAALITLAYFIMSPNVIVLSTDKNGFGSVAPQAAMLVFISLVVIALTVRRSGL